MRVEWLTTSVAAVALGAAVDASAVSHTFDIDSNNLAAVPFHIVLTYWETDHGLSFEVTVPLTGPHPDLVGGLVVTDTTSQIVSAPIRHHDADGERMWAFRLRGDVASRTTLHLSDGVRFSVDTWRFALGSLMVGSFERVAGPDSTNVHWRVEAGKRPRRR